MLSTVRTRPRSVVAFSCMLGVAAITKGHGPLTKAGSQVTCQVQWVGLDDNLRRKLRFESIVTRPFLQANGRLQLPQIGKQFSWTYWSQLFTNATAHPYFKCMTNVTSIKLSGWTSHLIPGICYSWLLSWRVDEKTCAHLQMRSVLKFWIWHTLINGLK